MNDEQDAQYEAAFQANQERMMRDQRCDEALTALREHEREMCFCGEGDHEAEVCDECGRSYDWVYNVPGAVWAKLHPRAPAGTLCPMCAERKARSLGLFLFWETGDGDPGYPTDQLRTALRELRDAISNSGPHPVGYNAIERLKRAIANADRILGTTTETA